eukprot:3691364-Amphidinium_carterae.1
MHHSVQIYGAALNTPSARHLDAMHFMRSPTSTRECARNDPEASQESGHWEAPLPLVNASEDVMHKECEHVLTAEDAGKEAPVGRPLQGHEDVQVGCVYAPPLDVVGYHMDVRPPSRQRA